MRLGFLAFAIATLFMATEAMCEEGLLFHAPFENGPIPAIAAGGSDMPFAEPQSLKYSEGKVGKCLQMPRGSQLVYEGLGNAYVAAGTLSFFWRPDDDVSESFTVIDLSPLEPINYSRFMRMSCSSKGLGLYCTLGTAGVREFAARDPKSLFTKGQWRHIALAWDQSRGIAIYLDGKPAAAYNQPWWHEGNFNHIGMGIDTRSNFRPGNIAFAQSYDELRIYDRWLDDAGIAGLAAAQTPKLQPLNLPDFLSLRRKMYSWDDVQEVQPKLSLTDGLGGMALRQVGIAQAKDVTRSNWRAFDGERARSWPSGGGFYNDGRALEFTLYPDQRFDVVQIMGSGPLSLTRRDDGNALFKIASTEYGVWRGSLAEAAGGEQFSVNRQEGRIHEMNLFQRVPFDSRVAPGEVWQSTALAELEEADAQWPEAVAVRRTCHPIDQTIFKTVPVRSNGTVHFPAMRAVHILGLSHPQRQGLGAIALNLVINSSAAQNVLRIDLIDPLNPERFLTTADVRLDGGRGRLRLILDARDVVLRPGSRPRIALTFRTDVTVDAAASAVAWKWTPVLDAMAQHCRDQLRRVGDVFQEISESRPWGYNPKALKTLGLMLNSLTDLHELEADNPVVAGYWHWVRPGEPKPRVELPAVPDGIPAWAVYEDEAIEKLKQVPYWWIDERENDAGEFGANDGINDDTDLVQDWWAMHLMRGPDQRLRDSLRRVAENSWCNGMRETGLGHYTDALHTYEDGMNAQCHMMLMDYGNPVYFERLLKTTSYYKDLLGKAPCGHLHFKASDYGFDGKGGVAIRTGSGAIDSGINSLALQPAMLLVWYSDHPYARSVLKDWTDGMIAHDMEALEKSKRISGASIHFESGKSETGNRSFGYGFFDAPYACFDLFGEKKYLDFIKLGMEAEMTGSNRRLRQTGSIAARYVHETGDQSFKDTWIAQARDQDLWKRSLHNDNYYELEPFYLSWQCTGDLNFITEGLKLTLNDVTWALPMLTVAEQSTDRVWTPQRLVNRVALGGPAMLRNELYPKLGLSWENATGRIASLVRNQDRGQFQTWIVNLEDRETTVDIRLWRLDHGRYEISEGPDRDQDGNFDGPAKSRTMELARFDIVRLVLPPKAVWLATCKQLEKLDDIRQRPDLAICADDVTYDAAASKATIRVHGIGAAPTGDYGVRITSGEMVLDKQGESLDPPLDSAPKVAVFEIPVRGEQEVTVEVDPGEKIAEITEVNNRIRFVPARLPPPWPKRH